MKYPPQFIDRIRQHFRVSEIVGSRVQLKRHGREFMGLCPFHKEKSPSFTVNDQKEFFHCFGCGAHGDVINFIKDHDNIHWGEAVKYLADQAGIPLPQLTQQERVEIDKTELLYQVMEQACVWFELQLTKAVGRDARDYIDGRGLTAATIDKFRMGYAPPDREALKNSLLQQGVTEPQMLEAGLLSKPDTGASFDKFRGRIMFPIRDSRGRVIAFGGRLMVKKDRSPKYLNSPETPLFKKGNVLYNADIARIAAGKKSQIIVTEGYMDVIALAQAGIEQSVAPLGTAITQDQLRMLWYMADEPIMCLDGDMAGNRAMLKAAELAMPMLAPNKSLRFAVIPAGEDPDSLIKSQGVAALNDILGRAIPLVDVIWQQHYASKNIKTPEQKAGAEKALMGSLMNIVDENIRTFYQQEMKKRIWEAGRSANSKQPFVKGKKGVRNLKGQAAIRPSIPPFAEVAAQQSITLCYRHILTLFILYPKLLQSSEHEELLMNISTTDASLQTLQHALIEHILPEEAFNRNDAITKLNEQPEMEELVEQLLAKAAMDINLRNLRQSNEDDGSEDAAMFISLQQQSLEERQLISNDFNQLIQQLGSGGNDQDIERLTSLHKDANQRFSRQNRFGKDGD